MHNKHEASDMSLTTLLKEGRQANGLQPGGFLKTWKSPPLTVEMGELKYPKRKGESVQS